QLDRTAQRRELPHAPRGTAQAAQHEQRVGKKQLLSQTSHGRCAQRTATLSTAPLEMQIASGTGMTKIRPSPIWPVRAAMRMVSTTSRVEWSGTTISSFTRGIQRTR